MAKTKTAAEKAAEKEKNLGTGSDASVPPSDDATPENEKETKETKKSSKTKSKESHVFGPGGQLIRTYSEGVHGENHRELAEEFASKATGREVRDSK